MKTKGKVLLLALCAVLLVTASVLGTMAYLTSQDSVTNTFTVGKVQITLDEAPVDADGKATNGTRVKANSYKLMPGHAYDKDPVVHFEAGSEASWLFVKVENGISAIESTEAGYKNIAAQIVENGWTPVTGETNVYAKKAEANTATGAAAVDYPVFSGFKVSGDVLGGTKPAAGAVDGALYIGDFANKTIVITAYAIQADGFADADAAWAAGGFTGGTTA